MVVEYVLEGAGVVLIQHRIVADALVTTVHFLRREGVRDPFRVGVVAEFLHQQIVSAVIIGHRRSGQGLVGRHDRVGFLVR